MAVETKNRSEVAHGAQFVADEFQRAAQGPDMAYHGLARVWWRAISSLREPFARMRWGSGSRAMSVA